MTSWLEDRFREYYAQVALKGPCRLTQREYALVPFSEQHMQRHMAMKTPDALMAMLRERVPAHVYYSSAFYEVPDGPTMAEKGWLGADLIFDLDADHLPGAHAMSYENMLRAVKRELVKLVAFFS